MNRQPILDSSNVKSIGHEGSTLEVEYLTGRVYQYQGVSAQVYRSLLASESKGKFINTVIKPQYKFTEIPKK